MQPTQACPHLVKQPELDTLFVLDSHVHLTDAFVQCRHCDAHYLVELADLGDGQGVFRISAIAADAVAQTIRSLHKGSCDINRARNEVFSLSTAARELDGLLLMRSGEFTAYVPRPDDLTLPRRSWRELPCDGSLVKHIAGLDHL